MRWSQRVEWTPGWRWCQHTLSGKRSKHETTVVFFFLIICGNLIDRQDTNIAVWKHKKNPSGTLNNKCCSIYLFEWIYSEVANCWWTYLRAKKISSDVLELLPSLPCASCTWNSSRDVHSHHDSQSEAHMDGQGLPESPFTQHRLGHWTTSKELGQKHKREEVKEGEKKPHCF